MQRRKQSRMYFLGKYAKVDQAVSISITVTNVRALHMRKKNTPTQCNNNANNIHKVINGIRRKPTKYLQYFCTFGCMATTTAAAAAATAIYVVFV